MKFLILLSFLFLNFYSNEYSKLINKQIDDVEVQQFLELLGSNYEYDDSYDEGNFYIYDNMGVELKFSKDEYLKAIFFKIDNLDSKIDLPLKINVTDTRRDIEKKLGEPNRLFRSMRDLKAYYVEEGVVVSYKVRDIENLNNPIKTISVEKVKN